jgi:hypothetical protein
MSWEPHALIDWLDPSRTIRFTFDLDPSLATTAALDFDPAHDGNEQVHFLADQSKIVFGIRFDFGTRDDPVIHTGHGGDDRALGHQIIPRIGVKQGGFIDLGTFIISSGISVSPRMKRRFQRQDECRTCRTTLAPRLVSRDFLDFVFDALRHLIAGKLHAGTEAFAGQILRGLLLVVRNRLPVVVLNAFPIQQSGMSRMVAEMRSASSGSSIPLMRFLRGSALMSRCAIRRQSLLFEPRTFSRTPVQLRDVADPLAFLDHLLVNFQFAYLHKRSLRKKSGRHECTVR